MKGLLIALGKKSAGPGSKDEGSAAQDYAREAYSALKDEDEEGFVEALLGAVRACRSKADDEDDEPDDDHDG